MCIDPLKKSPSTGAVLEQHPCLIVEPSGNTAAELRHYLDRLSFFASPDVCTSIAEAWELLRKKTYDLVWLDMSLPNGSAIDLIRSFSGRIPFIVTSAGADFAVDGFDLGVADYLLKPFTYLRFTRAVNRALCASAPTDLPAEHPFLFLKKGHAFQRFDHDDIDYVQAYGIYCKIVGQQKVEVVNDTISRLEQALPGRQFLRIHKSYIINLAKVTGYSHRNISMGHHQLPLGAAYRERFQGFLSLLGKKETD